MAEPLTLEVAYQAAFEFLEAYWERGGRSSDDIAALLGSMQRYGDEGRPLDVAQWHDFVAAVDRAKTLLAPKAGSRK